jgi:type 1 glutamine amidotransferase
MKRIFTLPLIAALLPLLLVCCSTSDVSKALIVTGQGDNWKASSAAIKQIIDETGLFTAKIIATPVKGQDMSDFSPDFSKYKLVIVDYNGDTWQEKTREAFGNYVNNGGGVVIYRSSVNAFPDWKEYGEMTGLRGGENPDARSSPFIYYSKNEIISDSIQAGGDLVSPVYEYEIRTRITDHPVTIGLPVRWLHAKDQIFRKLHGTVANTKILATAYSDTTFAGTGRDEPVILATNFGKGRIFTTLLGYADEGNMQAMECSGFIVTLQRGAEWAATGKVTQVVPYDFPNAAGSVIRPDYQAMTIDRAFKSLANYDIPRSTKYFTFIQEQVRRAAGDPMLIKAIEKKMIDLLTNEKASKESKKLILRELSWMGSDNCLPSVKAAATDPELKEDAEFALKRLQGN